MLKANSRKTVTDTFTIAISFDDGSVAAIHYFSNGATNFPKERIEVFTEGKILQLDNFRKLKGYGWNDFKKFNLFRQDKGQEACVRAFIHALKSGNPCIPEEEIFEVSNATLKAHEILLNQ